MKRTNGWGGWLLVWGALTLSVGASAGCSDDDDSPGSAGTAGSGGAGGKQSVGGTAEGGTAEGGAGGGGGAGGALQCDCGDDVDRAAVPLECACAAGLCTTFEDDLVTYRSGRFGSPFYVLLGTCASGYRTLSYQEAFGEQGGRRTYDAQGRMVFDLFGGYSGVVPDACGFDDGFSLGTVTIGEDPSKSCRYCLLAGDDAGADQPGEGGSGGASAGGAETGDAGSGGGDDGGPVYPESNTPRCQASDLE
jgi:hypothetical protein